MFIEIIAFEMLESRFFKARKPHELLTFEKSEARTTTGRDVTHALTDARKEHGSSRIPPSNDAHSAIFST